MTSTGNMVVKIDQTDRKTGSRNVNAKKEVKLGNRGKRKGEGQRTMPINHDMGAMVSNNIGRRWGKRRPCGVMNGTMASNPIRVRIRAKGSRNSPQGFLDKETIHRGGREKREESRVAFAKVDRDHSKN